MNRITTARCYLASAFLNDAMYLIGGSGTSHPENEPVSQVDVYLPNDNVWLEGKNLPTPRYGHTCCVVNDRIYVFGGKTIKDGQLAWNTDVDAYTATLSSGIDTPEHQSPKSFQLYQNYPNPFNPTTSLKFDCPVSAFVTLEICDLLGRTVKTIVREQRTAGAYTEQWNATDNQGKTVSSGLYLAVLKTETHQHSIKLVLMK
jgi:hypothetical protein